jgi:hypothetical protein
MNRGSVRRLGMALGTTLIVGLSVPAIAGAQVPSGAAQVPGVPAAGLPRTGNPEGDTAPMLPGVLLVAGGAVAAGLLVRGRRQREHGSQKQQ